MRKGMAGLSLLVQEHFKRDPFAGDVFFFPWPQWFAHQMLVARWRWYIALYKALGSGPLHMALGIRRRDFADHIAGFLSSGRHRLA